MQPVLVGAVPRSLPLAAKLSKNPATGGRLPRFTPRSLVKSRQVSGRRRREWAGSLPTCTDFELVGCSWRLCSQSFVNWSYQGWSLPLEGQCPG